MGKVKKVNFSLKAMKAHKGSRVMASVVLKPGTGW
jgi:hypothetical protein